MGACRDLPACVSHVCSIGRSVYCLHHIRIALHIACTSRGVSVGRSVGQEAGRSHGLVGPGGIVRSDCGGATARGSTAPSPVFLRFRFGERTYLERQLTEFPCVVGDRDLPTSLWRAHVYGSCWDGWGASPLSPRRHVEPGVASCVRLARACVLPSVRQLARGSIASSATSVQVHSNDAEVRPKGTRDSDMNIDR